MGAFPSHDAPELIYTTFVPLPSTDARVEVCLVPLLPRFFNDGHKKVKRKLNDLLTRKATQPTTIGIQPPTAAATTGAGVMAIADSANNTKRVDQTGSCALVDYVISSTESFFFVNTKDAVVFRDAAHEEQQKQQRKGGLFTAGSTSVPMAGSKTESTASQQPHSMHHAIPLHSVPSLLRPVPFAVCISDTEKSSNNSTTNTGSSHSSVNRPYPTQSSNIVLIKGRRLQLIGFISSCMDRQVHLINTAFPAKTHILNGGSSTSSSSALAGDEKKSPLPVVLDVVFEDMESYSYLTESVVLLASFAFRKQFVNSCALHYPAGDADVEAAFDRHMERLQLRLVLRSDNYRGLRMFYSHYMLLDMVKELGMQKCSPTHFSMYENSHGDYGIEVNFGSTFLSRWMRYVEKKMIVESVGGGHVRCVTSALLQERDRLLQERQDSGAFLEEEEDDERLFGGALLVSALKKWLLMGSRSHLQQQQQQQQAQPGMGSQLLVFPSGGGYWPQMPMMMGGAPGWPAGVVPFTTAPPQMSPMVGPPPQFVISSGGAPVAGGGGRPQLYHSAPPQASMPGNSAFLAPGGMHIVPTSPAAYGVAPAPGAPQQQILYMMPGGQLSHPATLPHAAAASAPAFPAGATPQMYYPQPTTYAVSYHPCVYQQPDQQQRQSQQQQQGQAPPPPFPPQLQP